MRSHDACVFKPRNAKQTMLAKVVDETGDEFAPNRASSFKESCRCDGDVYAGTDFAFLSIHLLWKDAKDEQDTDSEHIC